MAAQQTFRAALNGFNREDVVRYIEYINSKYKTETNQLRSEIANLKNEMVTRVVQAAPDHAAAEELIAVKARCSELEEEVARLRQALAAAQDRADAVSGENELETYRRAERVERQAQERAAQMESQAQERAEQMESQARERAELVRTRTNAVLAEASLRVEGAAGDLGVMADQVAAQLTQLQTAVLNSKQALADAAEVLYALAPDQNNED